MSRDFTAQEKLALIFTAVGSQRKMAEFMGITHQKLGRWLKEGQEGGVKQIPTDLLTQQGINDFFDGYVQDVVKPYAERQGLPFMPDAPVFLDRKKLRKTEMGPGGRVQIYGDRVTAENTQFIRPELRHELMGAVRRTKRFTAVSLRSTVNLAMYNKGAQTHMKGRTRTEDQEIWAKEFRKEIREGVERRPIYTRLESVLLNDTKGLNKALDAKLRQKHEPATGEKGTALADAFLFQLKPTPKPANPNDVKRPTTAKPSAAKVARRRQRTLGGRGPK